MIARSDRGALTIIGLGLVAFIVAIIWGAGQANARIDRLEQRPADLHSVVYLPCSTPDPGVRPVEGE